MLDSAGCGGAHILIFPYPAQGHMLPLLDFTHQLAARGLTITILVTPKNVPILSPLLSKYPSIQTLVLPLPPHPSIPAGVENVKDLPFTSFTALYCALGKLYDPILHWFRSQPSPPVAIISDFFLGWTHHLACQLGIPRIVFSPSSAAAISLMHLLWRDLPTRENPNDPNFPITFSKAPNSPTYPWWQLSPIFRSYVQGEPEMDFIRDSILANLASWGIVFNSFKDLDGVYLMNYVREELGPHRVWAVGPLLPPDDNPSIERGGSNSVAAGDVMSWLDRFEDHTVVYVCFGSQVVLSNEQMEALAAALEVSGCRFVWCVKEASGGSTAFTGGASGVVPSGFEERVGGRGLVIRGWAPQVLILRHRAVGAFLTHCGWNSVLEALVAGVPMLAWPMGADQFINARLLVEEKGMAVKLCEGRQVTPNSTELAKAIAESVGAHGPKTKSVRVRAMETRQAALHAINPGGTSFKDLDQLVNDLNGLKLRAK
ncbi:PREDICTED: UDP-glycosyltransferase 89B2-like [Nelumbo nucifera]|uniref:Glycosyltransferase n=1 Tax=Nelumbo nucifera TaxID=4432 RepID=A0A1U8A4L6_NELNU|nr:PREDICTED: UDP-glycosyltransferase 89B2-like [Nelumbo nucifera]